MSRIHFAADSGGYELGRALQARAEAAGHGSNCSAPCQRTSCPADDYPRFTTATPTAIAKRG